MVAVTGGTEVALTANAWSPSNLYGEMVSAGGASTTATAIQAPTGRGWVYSPGAGQFAAANWSASIAMADPANGTDDPTAITLRFFKYSGGIYTSIGTIALAGAAVPTTRTVLSFAATSMPLTNFSSGDLLYIDLWWQSASNATV